MTPKKAFIVNAFYVCQGFLWVFNFNLMYVLPDNGL